MKKIVTALVVLAVLAAGVFLVDLVVDHVSEGTLLAVGVSIGGTTLGLVVASLILAFIRANKK